MGILKNVPVLRKAIEIGYTLFVVIALSVIVGLILAFPVMWLWNFVFGKVYYINVVQAWALNILCGVLFGKTSEAARK